MLGSTICGCDSVEIELLPDRLIERNFRAGTICHSCLKQVRKINRAIPCDWKNSQMERLSDDIIACMDIIAKDPM